MSERASRVEPVLRLVPPVLLFAAIASCSAHLPAPPPPAGRTVVISFDGLGGLRMNEFLAAGKLRAGGFSAFADRGVLAGRAIDVTPSLTPSAHISAITGTPPSRNGIVGNHFYDPTTPFGRPAGGFIVPIEAETLWEAAARQGKRVGILLYPGADGQNARRRGAFGLIWPDRAAQDSSFATLGKNRWTGARSSPGIRRTFSPARSAAIAIREPGGRSETLRLTAFDTTDDGVVGYDLLRVERDGRSPIELRTKGWFRLDVPGDGGTLTSWCRLVAFDPGLEELVLYVGPFYAIPAYPEEYRRLLETEVGGWPCPPDYALMRAGRDEKGHEEQAARLADYLTKVLVLTIRTQRFDLLIGYQPLVDEIEHAFEPGPDGGSLDAIERAFANADRSVADVLSALTPQDSFVILSDHGMVPLTRAVNIDRFFQEKGWTLAKEADSAPPGARRLQIGASSGIAHLYVDPALPLAEREEAAAALYSDAQDLPAEVLDMILPHRDLAQVSLDNPRSGDVVVLLKPGIEFSTSPAGVLGPAHQRGGHGYRNVTPVLDASFMALGPGIARARPATVSLLDVAPVAARALGIEPPSGQRATATLLRPASFASYIGRRRFSLASLE